ncbi:MAG: putative phage abortive infection protein [Dysgonamonadaceae bacterium]|jgi:hypothetical protein|nr:putative phage abortive infection protein [Dysgonamonadaceae bacterium]
MNISFSDIGIIADIVLAVVALVTLFWYFYSFRRQKLDDKFYELLRLHRQNVEEMKVGLLVGRQSFKEMFYELGNCQIVVNNIFNELKKEAGNNSFANPNDKEKKQLADFYTSFDCSKRKKLAYQLFFHGIEFNHICEVIYQNESVLQAARNTIEEKLRDNFLKQYDNWQQGNFSMADNKKSEDGNLISFYRPYCGQSYWLGHYFRHLYQTVKFIDKVCLCKKTKYEYIKTLQAQLSEYEQAILFYHACSDSGTEWFEGGGKSFIVKYRLIRHLPLLMVYGEKCGDFNYKLSQILSKEEIKEYFKSE